MERVLFSVVGKSDPISFYRDSAILHFVRIKKPRYVYLFMTNEMLKRNKNHCLENVLRALDEKVEVVLFQHPEITNPQEFGKCDPLFYAHLTKEIKLRHPNAEIWINLTSGTQQMTASLSLVSAQLDFPVRLFQVTLHPDQHLKNHDNEDLFEKTDGHSILSESLDNDEKSFENRMNEVENKNIVEAQVTKYIHSLTDAYNYKLAYEYAKKHSAFFTEDSIEMLRIAWLKYSLNQKEARKAQSTFDFYPVAGKPILFDYLLYIQTKLEQGDLGDFARAVSPALKYLYNETIQKLSGINVLKEIVVDNKVILGNLYNQFPAISEMKESRDGIENNLFERILDSLNSTEPVVEKLKSLRDFEKRIRNQYAHDIVCITEDEVRKKIGESPKTIMKHMKAIYQWNHPDLKGQLDWDFYKTLNQVIKKTMKGDQYEQTRP